MFFARALVLTACLAFFALPRAVAQTYPTPEAAAPSNYPAPSPHAALSPLAQARLRTLEADLALLAAHSHGRVLDGALRIAVGSAFVSLGVFVDDARALLLTLGGASIAQGINTLVLLPDVQAEVRAFALSPRNTPAQVDVRIRLGEQTLARIAKRTRAARLLGASVTMAAAAAYVPVYWALSRAEDSRYRFGDDSIDFVLLTLAGLGFAAGLVEAIIPSEAERRWSDYQELKASSSSALRGLPQFRLGMTRQGASVGLGLRF
jgi:hypothetical protein